MNDQNTATANRLKTANPNVKHAGDHHRVNLKCQQQPEQREVGDEKMIDDGDEAGARQSRYQRAVKRLRDEQRHERRGEHPRQVAHAAGDAHLVAQRAEHVISRKQREEIGK